MKRFNVNTAAPRRCVLGSGAALAMLAASMSGAQTGDGPDYADVTYATAGTTELALDIYLPEADAPAPLVVWVHGGAWRFGSKANPPARFVESGYALASVEFRQSTEAPFPAMVHDIKAAIRFLKANAAEYGYSVERVAVAGVSSGGHLAALVAATDGEADLEGELGAALDQSSAVQAAISYSGASNLTTILAQSTPRGLGVREPALELLLGALPDEVPEVARAASPVFYIDANDPPLLLLHGDQDTQMPINQAHELHGAYLDAGLDAELLVVHGAGHGGGAFYDDERWSPVAAFLRRTLRDGAEGEER